MSSSTQEIFATLTAIDALLKDINVRVDTIGVKTRTLHASGEVREIEYLFYRVTSLMKKMGLPPEVDAALSKLMNLVLMVRMLHTTLMFLQSGTFFGLAMTALVGLGAMYTGADTLGGLVETH